MVLIRSIHKYFVNLVPVLVLSNVNKTFLPKPRPRLFFVLEAPRDQDLGLEDYITACTYKYF